MCLTKHNKILTKDNLNTKGCTGSPTCLFCAATKTVTHLFLKCPLIQQIWFWLGETQDYMHNWDTFEDINDFALHLPGTQRAGFLIVVSALCWVVWKYYDDIFFDNSLIKIARSIILIIKFLVLYWTGNLKKKAQISAEEWLPVIEDAIPLDQYMPLEIVVYQLPPGSTAQE